MNKRFLQCISAVLITVFLSGCSITGMDAGNLMRPPRATAGEQDDIQRAIESSVGKEVSYKYPRRGDYRYGIIQYDIDGDSVREAIAFYKDKRNSTGTRIIILDKTESGEWKVKVDSEGVSTDVDRVLFYDFDGDGISEILVGWVGYSTNVNTLSVYRYEEKDLNGINVTQQQNVESTTLREIVQLTYSELMLCNLDRSGGKELITFELNTGSKQAKAKVWRLNTNEEGYRFVDCIETIDINGNATGYQNCRLGYTASGEQAVFLDELTDSDMIQTQVITYNSDTKKFEAPLYLPDEGIRKARFSAVDIDGDGIVEIPTETFLPCYNSESSDIKMYLTTWNAYDKTQSSKLKPIFSAVHNRLDGYYIILQNEWIYDLTARIDATDKTMFFHRVDRSSGSTELIGAEVFRVHTCKAEDFNKYEKLGFEKLLEENEKIYCALIIQNTNSSIQITYDDLRNNIRLFSRQNS